MLWRASLGEFLPSLFVVLSFTVAGFAAQSLRPMPGLMRPFLFLPSFVFFPFVGLYTAVAVVAWCRWRRRRSRTWEGGVVGWKAAWRTATAEVLHPDVISRLVLACLFMPLLLNTFGSWKLAIGRWAGFSRDPLLVLMSLDLHGGMLDWYRLQPVLGHPAVTAALDLAYFTWLPVFVTFVIWQMAWREPARERRRFLLALTLVWLGLGVVGATVGASAGPIFLDHVMPGAEDYADMFAYLTAVNQKWHLITFDVRSLLWTAREHPPANPFTGISAFPSIHVAMATTYVLAVLRSHPRGKWAAVGYALLIAISSVHLGWHYALDAYAGAAGALLCWALAGALTRRSVGAGA